MPIEIKKLRSQAQKEQCARWQVANDPWKTLGATYERCLRGFDDRTKYCYMLYEGKKPAGFLILVKQGALRGYIATIFVAPEYQGKGMGSHAMAFAEKELLRDFPNVFLSVSSFNKAAVKLYRRLGYKKIGLLKDYFVKGHDEIIMRKTKGPIIKG